MSPLPPGWSEVSRGHFRYEAGERSETRRYGKPTGTHTWDYAADIVVQPDGSLSIDMQDNSTVFTSGAYTSLEIPLPVLERIAALVF